MNTIINVNLTWLKKDTDPIQLNNGRITVTDNQIVVTCEMSSADSNVFSLAHPAGINLYTDLEEFVEYSDAKIDGKPIKLKTKGAHVLSYRCRYNKGGIMEASWDFSDISYSYASPMVESYYLLDIPFIHLTAKLGNMRDFPKEISFEKEGHKFLFAQAEDAHQTIMQVCDCSDETIDNLLVHMIFFFHTLVNVYKKNIFVSGKEYVTVHIPHFKLKEESLRHPELQFINIGNPNTFGTFFQNSKWAILEVEQQKVLKQAVYTFARSKYCDDTTQFLMLYSILDRYAGNSHGISPYAAMKEGLSIRGIAISKIGPATDRELQLLHLQLIHDNGDKVDVTNFCNLRNYIMHFMATSEIDNFLIRSNVVSNMRFAVTTILLQEFGFGDFTFHKGWEHLSVFND